MACALAAIIDPGDEVIIHEPYFSPYKQQVELVGGMPVFIPTFEKEAFKSTSRFQGLSLRNPCNHYQFTQQSYWCCFFSRNFWKNRSSLPLTTLTISRWSLWSLFADDTFVPMAAFAPENTITFSSFSKPLPWQAGGSVTWSHLNRSILRKTDQWGDRHSAPTPSQRAGIYALNHYDTLVPRGCCLKERLDIEQRVAEIPFLPYPQSKEACMPSSTLNKRGWTLSALSRNY